MRTEAQINASRLNGAKSRGPVTDAGKLASSQNALKHGLLSSRILLKDESPEAFDALASEFYDEFQPATTFERSLVDNMIAARWRHERISMIERANFELQIEAEDEQRSTAGLDPETLTGLAFRSLATETRVLDLINRYESLYDRQYLRAHKRVMEIRRTNQKPGPAAPPVAIDSAKRTQEDPDPEPPTQADAAPAPEPIPFIVRPAPSTAPETVICPFPRSQDQKISPTPLAPAA